MGLFICLMTLLLSFSSVALEKEKIIYQSGGEISFEEKLYESRRISREYIEGRYLIYDCEGGHFACVNGDGFRSCQSRREAAVSAGDFFLPCGPLKEFLELDECQRELGLHMYGMFNKTFCQFQRKVKTYR